MTNLLYLEEALEAAKLRLALAERRRVPDHAGASLELHRGRIDRARAAVERLEKLLEDHSIEG